MADSHEFAGSKAEALLDAHVAWVMSRLDGDALRAELEKRLDDVLADAAHLRLGDVVSQASVEETAVGYAAHMKIGGAIPALVGDIAAAIYTHPIHADTALEELLPEPQFEELLDKLLEMQQLRDAMIHQSVTNPIFASLATQLVYSSLQDYVSRSRRLAARVPGARTALKAGRMVARRAGPALGARLGVSIKSYVDRTAISRMTASERYLRDAFESDALRQAVLDFWDDNKHRSVASVRDFAGQLDIEELFVIGYEYWQRLRRMPIYRALIESGVAVFFDTYREATLTELLDDIGVTRDMMVADGMRFLPQVIAALNSRDMLEPAIRRQFEDFYRSEAVRAILNSR